MADDERAEPTGPNQTAVIPLSLLTAEDRRCLAAGRRLDGDALERMLTAFFTTRLHLVFPDLSNDDAIEATSLDVWAQLTDEGPDSTSPRIAALNDALEAAVCSAIEFAFDTEAIVMLPPDAPKEEREALAARGYSS